MPGADRPVWPSPCRSSICPAGRQSLFDGQAGQYSGIYPCPGEHGAPGCERGHRPLVPGAARRSSARPACPIRKRTALRSRPAPRRSQRHWGPLPPTRRSPHSGIDAENRASPPRRRTAADHPATPPPRHVPRPCGRDCPANRSPHCWPYRCHEPGT